MVNKDRPYEFVPTYALIVLIEAYDKLVSNGEFKFKPDFERMLNEMELRFSIHDFEEKQISIEEYMRSRKNE